MRIIGMEFGRGQHSLLDALDDRIQQGRALTNPSGQG
jgi:hypothetical protein